MLGKNKKFSSAFGYIIALLLLLVGVVGVCGFIIFLQNQAHENEIKETTFEPATCVGWEGSENAREISLPKSANIRDFSLENSAASTVLAPSSLGETAEDLPSINKDSITCSGFSIDEDILQEKDVRSVHVQLSFAADAAVPEDDVVSIEYSFNGSSWTEISSMTVEPGISNYLHDGYWTYDLTGAFSIEQLTALQLRVVHHGTSKGDARVYVDGISLELGLQKKLAIPELPADIVRMAKLDFSFNENPTFYVKTEDRSLLSFLGSTKVRTIQRVDVVLPDGTEQPGNVTYAMQKNGMDSEQYFTIKTENFSKPGLYKVLVYLVQDGVEQTVEEPFWWGALGVNVRASVGSPTEYTEVNLGLVDEEGKTICDGDIDLDITTPQGNEQRFSTSDGSIVVNETCVDKSVTNEPDYSALVQTLEEGTYEVSVVAHTESGDHAIRDSFKISSSAPFLITRNEFPTRIYPLAEYPVSFTVTAKEAYAGKLTEQIPADMHVYDISDGGTLAYIEGESGPQTITWDVSLQASETKTFSYTFNPPDIAPALFLFGPITVGEFSESRVWQMASDSVGFTSSARLWSSGVELQSVTANEEFTSTSGTAPTIDTTNFRSGAAALATSASAATSYATYQFKSANTQDDFYVRAYLRIGTLPGSTIDILSFRDSTPSFQASIRLTSAGKLQLYNDEDSAQVGSDSTATLSTGTWYRLELRIDLTTLSSTIVDARLDGVSFASGTVNHANGVYGIAFGVEATATATFQWDDIAINDDTGIADNWPGPGKIVYLRPNADVSNTCGTGTYSTISETNPDDATSYIVCDANNDSVVVDVTDSSTAGIGTYDTIKVAQIGARYRRGTTGATSTYRVTGLIPSSGSSQNGTLISDTTTTWSTNSSTAPRHYNFSAFSQTYSLAGGGAIPIMSAADLDTARIGFVNPDSTRDAWVSNLWLLVEYEPAVGGRLWSSGFELQSATAGVEWETVNGSPSIDTTTYRGGLASLRINSLSSTTKKDVEQDFYSSNTSAAFYARYYIRIDSPPSGDNRIMSFKNASDTDIAYMVLTSSRTLKLYDEDGQVGSASTVQLAGESWYRVEIKIDTTGSGANDTVEAKIDGASAFATSATRDLSSGIAKIAVGGNLNSEAQTTGDWYFDDIAVNQNIGSSQNGYPGEGVIVHMQPDSAGDNTAWTNDYTTVDEVAPDDASTVLTSGTAGQIEDVNYESSSNAGIPSTATINVVSAGARFRDDVADVLTHKLRLKDNVGTGGAGGAMTIYSNDLDTNTTTWRTHKVTAPRLYQLTTYDRPHQANAWTTSTLDTAQTGVELTTSSLEGSVVQVTALWLMVDYTSTSTITVSGNIYSAEPSTAYNCSTNTITVRVSVNGSATESTGDCTLATGAYSVTATAPVSVGDPVAIFIDSGESISGTTVTLATSTTANITSVPIFTSKVSLSHETASTSPMRNLKLARADNANAGIRYAVSSGALTTDSAMELHVITGKTYTAGGTVTTNSTGGDFHIDDNATATLDTATSTIGLAVTIDSGATLNITNSTTVNGDSGVTVTGTLAMSGGTFTVGDGVVEDIAVSGASAVATFSGGTTNIKDDLLISNGATTITSTVNVDGNGSGSLIAISGGTFTIDTGATVNFTGEYQATGGTTNWNAGSLVGATGATAASSHMRLRGGSTTYLRAASIYTGTDSVFVLADTAGTTTFYMTSDNGNIYTRGFLVYNTGTLTTGNGSGGDPAGSTIHLGWSGGTSTTRTFYDQQVGAHSFYNLQIDGDSKVHDSTDQTITLQGSFTISSGKTFNGNDNTISVAGNFVNGGSYTAGTSTVIMAGATGGAINGGNDTTFYNLSISPTGVLQGVDINGSDDPIISNNLSVTTNEYLSIGSGRTITINPAATYTFPAGAVMEGPGKMVYKSTTAFPTTGTMSSGTIIRFDTSSNNVTMSARTYRHVEVYGNNTSNSVIAAAGTYTISQTFSSSQDGTGNTVFQLNTNDPVLTITGNATIGANTTFASSSSSVISFAGNLTNQGTFTNYGGSVTFSGSAQQTITGPLTVGSGGALNNVTITNNSGSDPELSPSIIFTGDIEVIGTLTVNTAGVKMLFNTAYSFTVCGLNLNGSSGAGNQVYLRSSTPGTYYVFWLSLVYSQTLTYVDAKDADSSDGTQVDATGTGNVNSGHNLNWNFGNVTVSGTVYTDDGVTPYNCTTDGGGQLDLGVTTAGGTSTTGACTATNGTFSLTTTAPSGADDPVVLYIASTESKKATTATLSADASSTISINLYENRLLIDSESGTSMTNALLSTGDNGNAGIRYSVSGGALTVESGLGLYVLSSKTFAPAGAVTTPATATTSGSAGDATIAGTLNMAANKLTVGGDFTNNGTYTISSGQDTEFSATGTGFSIVDGTATFQDVIFNGSGGGWSFSSAVAISGDVTATLGSLSGTNDITVSGGDVTGDGEINLTGGTFSLSGTGNFGGSGMEWTFYNLTFAQSGVADMTTTGTGANQINISNVLTTSTSGGFNHILKAGARTWRILGTGSSFVNSGRFEGQTSTVYYYTTTGATLPTMNNATTNYFHDILFEGNNFHGDAQYTFPSGTTYITGDFYTTGSISSAQSFASTNNPNLTVTGNFTCDAGTMNTITTGTGTWTVSGNLNLSGCELTASAGHTFVMNGTSKTFTEDGSNGVYNLTLSGTITLANMTHIIEGDLVLSGTITAGTSEVKMTGASKTINGGGESLYNFTVDVSGTGTVTTTSAGFFVTKGLTVAADDTFSVGSYAVWWRGDTFSMQATSTISGTGILYVDTTTILGEVGTISSGVSFYTGNGNTTVMPDRPSYGYDGNVQVVNDSITARTLTMQAGTIDIAGNLTVDTEDMGTLTLNGDTNDPAVNIGGNVTWSQLDTLNGTPNTTSGTGTWTVSGNFTDGTCYTDDLFISCYTATSGNILDMAGANKALTALAFTGSVFSNVTVSGTIAFNERITVSSTLLITGTLTAETRVTTAVTLYIGGTFRNNGTFNHNSGHVYFSGATPVIDGTNDTTFYYLTIGPSGSSTVTVDTDTGTDDPSVTGTLSVVSGDSFVIESGRTVTFTGGAHTLTLSGTINGAGLFIYKSSTAFPSTGTMTADVRFDATDNNVSTTGRTFGGDIEVYNTSNTNARTVTFGSAAGQTVTASKTVSLTRTGSQTVTLDLNTQDPTVNITEGLTINTGTILSASNSATLALSYSVGLGDFAYVNAGTFTHNNGLVTVSLNYENSTFDSTGASSASFYNFTESCTDSGSLVLESSFDVDNDFTIGADCSFDTKAAENNSMTVGGDWTNNATFEANAALVTLDGAALQTLSGGLSTIAGAFYNLTITNNSGTDPVTDPSVIFATDADVDGTFIANTANTKIRFNAGDTYAFQNIDLDGQATGTRVYLRSSSQNTQWNLNVAGTRSVSNTDVRDSNACAQPPDIDATDGTNYDATNNDCWLIDSLTFSISDTTIGFGDATSGASRYATGNASGSATETEAHTLGISTNAGDGYTLTVYGPTLTSGGNTIDAIGGSNTAPAPGTEQFGLRITATGGSGTVSVPYAAAGFAYDGVSAPDEVASSSIASSLTTYSVRYLVNVLSSTESGVYLSDLTYVVTSNF